MLEFAYVYILLLGCLYVYKTLSTDPERDKIWGTGKTNDLLSQKEKEIGFLKTQLDQYQNYQSSFEKETSRQESTV